MIGFPDALGKHVLAEFYNCDAKVLNDKELLEKLLKKTAQDAGATVVCTAFHAFAPHGISGVVVIKESHLAVHSWPEHAYAAVDVFTCSPELDLETACRLTAEVLGAERYETKIVDRGAFDKVFGPEIPENLTGNIH